MTGIGLLLGFYLSGVFLTLIYFILIGKSIKKRPFTIVGGLLLGPVFWIKIIISHLRKGRHKI